MDTALAQVDCGEEEDEEDETEEDNDEAATWARSSLRLRTTFGCGSGACTSGDQSA